MLLVIVRPETTLSQSVDIDKQQAKTTAAYTSSDVLCNTESGIISFLFPECFEKNNASAESYSPNVNASVSQLRNGAGSDSIRISTSHATPANDFKRNDQRDLNREAVADSVPLHLDPHLRRLLLGDAGRMIAMGTGIPKGTRPGYLYSFESATDDFVHALTDAELRVKAFFSQSDIIDRLWEMFPGEETGKPSAQWLNRAQSLVSNVLNESFSTEVQFVGFDVLNGAMAGFIGEGPGGESLILVNRDWLAMGISHHGMVRLALEEIGHSFDWAINDGIDSPGDEGELFAAIALGKELHRDALERIMREDDWNTVTLNGVDYDIQEASITFAEGFVAISGGSNNATAGSIGKNLRFTSIPDEESFAFAASGSGLEGFLETEQGTIRGVFSRRSPTGNTRIEALLFNINSGIGTGDLASGKLLWLALSNVATYGPDKSGFQVSANNSGIAAGLDDIIEELSGVTENSTITADPTSIEAGGITTSTITVQLKDESGNITTGGDNVVLFTDLGTISSVTDNLNGTYTATLTSSVTSGKATITGIYNGVDFSDTAEVFFILPATQLALMSVENGFIKLNGSTTVSVTVLDTNGSPVPGVNVSFSSNQTDRATVTGPATSGSDGVATATITGADNLAGEVTITASISASDANVGTSDTQTATLTVLAPPVLTVNDLITSDTTPTITGTSDLFGGTVTVTIDGEIYTAIVQSSGTWSVLITPALNDGEYSISASITDAAGNTTIADGTLIIDATPLTITLPTGPGFEVVTDPDSQTDFLKVTINGPTTTVATLSSNKDVTWSISGGVNSGLFQVGSDGAVTLKNPVDAGSYFVDVKAEAANGDVVITSIWLQRVPVALTLTADAKSKVYGDDDPVFTHKITSGVFDASQGTITGALSRVAGESVGEYNINRGTLSYGPNYDITFVGAKLTITPKVLTLSGKSGLNKVYDGTKALLPGVDAFGALTGVKVGDDVNVSGTPQYAQSGVGNGVSVEQGTVALTGPAAGNYTLSWTNGSGDITRAELRVQVNDDSKFENTADPLGFKGVTITGFVSGENISVVNTSGLRITRDSGEDPGTYTLSAIGLTASNYDFEYLPGTFTIIPANQLSVRVANASTVYGSEASFTLLEVTYVDGNGNVVDITESSSISGAAVTVNAGEGRTATFTISPVTSGSVALTVGSYSLVAGGVITGSEFSETITVNGSLTVTPKPITVSVTGGKSRVYDGSRAMAALTLSLTGLEAGDVVNASGIGLYANKNAGSGKSYTVQDVQLTGADAGNYSTAASFTGTDGEVTQRLVTLAGKTGVTKSYDGTTAMPPGEAGYGSLQNVAGGDQLTVSGAPVFASAEVGTGIAIEIGSVALGGIDAGNYTLNWTNGTGEITKAVLTIKVNNDSRFVGQPDLSGFAGFTVIGLQGGDKFDDVTDGTVSINRSNLGVNEAGTYSGVLVANETLTSGKYDIVYLPGDYTIVGADQLLVRIAPTVSVYGTQPIYVVNAAEYLDQDDVIVDLKSSAVVNGNQITVTDGDGGSAEFDVVPNNPQVSSSGRIRTGSYVLRPNNVVVVSENFSRNLILTGSLNVVPRTVTAQVDAGIVKEYDGTAEMVDLEVSIDGGLFGDAVALGSVSGAYDTKNVGTGKSYTITGLSLTGDDAGQYTLGSTSQITGIDGIISPASLLTISQPADQVFTGTAFNPAVTVTGVDGTLVEGTDYTLTYANNTNVGQASVTAFGIGNYTNSRAEFFEITPANFANLTFSIAAIADQVVTGSAIEPGVVVSDGTTTLVEGIDYTVAYTNNTDVGTATATVTGIGNYAGTLSGSFEITTGDASKIVINNPGDTNNQSATVGLAVENAPSVLVTDSFDNPLEGVSVTFEVATGGGNLTDAEATTDANGIATVGSWTLGTTAGENTLTATSGSLTGSPVTITATGTAGAPTQIAINAGDGQSATVGTAVDIAPSVLVTDANDNPVAGVGVTFTVVTGGGSVTGPAATTTTDGIGTLGSWILGTTSGTNTLSAAIAGSVPEVTTSFTATGTAGAADATASTIVADPDETSTDGSSTITVQLKDAADNDLGAGLDVFLAITDGDGSLSDGPWTTDENGQVSATLSSGTIGTVVVSGYIGADADGSVLGTASVSFGAGAAAQLVSMTIQDAFIKLDGTTTVSVTVLDANDNPVAGVEVSFTSDETDRATVSDSATTDESGVASATITGASEQQGEVTITGSITSDDDNVAESVSETAILTVLAPPSLEANDLVTNDTTPTITGTSDLIGGEVTVTINEKEYTATVAEDGTWSVEIPEGDELGDGTYTIEVSITDEAGNTSTAEGSLTIDTEKPVIVANDPEGGIIIIDEETGSQSLELTIDAPEKTVANFGANKTVSWSLIGGENEELFSVTDSLNTLQFKDVSVASLTPYEVLMRATDISGNSTEIIVTVNVREADSPIVSLSNPDDGILTIDEEANINTLVITLDAPVTTVTTFTSNKEVIWSVQAGENADLFEIDGDGQLKYIAPLSNKESLNVIIRAEDSFNNFTDTIVLLTITFPAVSECINTSQSGGTTTMYVGCTAIEYIYEQRENNTLAVYSSDSQVDLALTALNEDGDPLPIVNGLIRLQREGGILVQGFGMLPQTEVRAWIFSDPFYLGSAVVQSDSTFREILPIADELEPGEHTLILSGITFRGDTLSLSIGVFLDSPALSVDDQITSSKKPLIQGDTDQPIGTKVKIIVDGMEFEGSVTTLNRWEVQITTDLSDGEYTVVAMIEDPSGVETTVQGKLTIKSTPPTLTINSETTSDTSPEITGKSDVIGGTVTVTINEKEYTATVDEDGNWSITIPDEDALRDGSYIVEASITDKAGNVSNVQGNLVVCTGTVQLSGFIKDVSTNLNLPNVMLSLIPQGDTPGPTLITITDESGRYEFSSKTEGGYLVQVEDLNLNVTKNLYPVISSQLFTDLKTCNFVEYTFEYGPSDRNVIGGFLWYDVNKNGKKDVWFDANDDGEITQNLPDDTGFYSFTLDEFEWVDVNGSGTFDQPEDIGELNRAGFGNEKNPNIFIEGPNGYKNEIIIGILGNWRTSPEEFGEYTVQLVVDENLEAQAKKIAKTNKVKAIPNTASKKIFEMSQNNYASIGINNAEDYSEFFNAQISALVCPDPQPITINITDENRVFQNLDISISCFDVVVSLVDVPDGNVNQITTITLTVSDFNGAPVSGIANKLSFGVGGTNKDAILSQVRDNGNGTYSVTYTPEAEGLDEITIALDGVAISDIPYPSNVRSDRPKLSVNDLLSENATPTITGTSDLIGGTVTVTINEKEYTATVTEDSTWSVTIPQADALADGEYTIQASITGLAGNTTIVTGTLRVSSSVITLVFTQNPKAIIEAGFDIGKVVVTAESKNGEVALEFSGDVELAITKGTGGDEAGDASLLGVVRVQAVNGVATFSGLKIQRAGFDYTLTGTSPGVISGVSKPFSVRPGPPATLNLREDTSEDEQLKLIIGNGTNKTNGGVSANQDGNLVKGNRVRIRMVIFDEFGNITFVPEGDTKVDLDSDSESGNFFKDQFNTQPISNIVVPRNQRETFFYYEDPIPAIHQLNGKALPPPGSRVISPAETTVEIRTPSKITASPNVSETKMFKRSAIVVSLTDESGNRAFAPVPGISISLSSSSETGEFYLTPTGGAPVTSHEISPARSSVILYYRDRTLGMHTLTFSGNNLPQPTTTAQITIVEGGAMASNSTAEVPGGRVDEVTSITVNLLDILGSPVNNVIGEIMISILEGPNAGLSLTGVNNGDGSYTFSYVPVTSGIDIIQIMVGNESIPGSPFESNVTMSGARQLQIQSGNNQTGRILSKLDKPFSVQVRDELGRAVANKPISFELLVEPKGASRAELLTDRVISDDNGVAQTQFVLGSLVGDYRIQASADGFEPAAFIARAEGCSGELKMGTALASFIDEFSCGPYSYEVTVSDTNPSAGSQITVSAQLLDRFGNRALIEGITVFWDTAFDGRFQSASSNTDQQGRVTVQYNVGNTVGSRHIITAKDEFEGNGLSPMVTPRGGDINQLIIYGPDLINAGETAGPYKLVLLDEFRNDIIAPKDLSFSIELQKGKNVKFMQRNKDGVMEGINGNQILIAASKSGADFYLYQTETGKKTLSAFDKADEQSLSSSKPLVFSADPKTTNLSLVAGDGQKGAPLQSLSKAFRVEIADQFDNRIAGRPVSYEIVTAPASAKGMYLLRMGEEIQDSSDQVQSLVVVTDSLGQADIRFVLGDQTGEYIIEASSPGLDAVRFTVMAAEAVYSLQQNFPNPFSGATTIGYNLPEASHVRIEIYDMIGRRVSVISDGIQEGGFYRIQFNAGQHGLASGVYLYRIVAVGAQSESTYTDVKKMVYIK